MIAVLLISLAGPAVIASDEGKPAADAEQKTESKDKPQETTKAGFSQEEIDAIAAALPEGETRQLFENKFTDQTEAEDGSDDEFRSGEGFSVLFLDGIRAISHAQEKLKAFFSASHGKKGEWKAAFDNLNQGRGTGHLLTTILVTATLIMIGLVTERLFKKPLSVIMDQVLENPGVGRIRFVGRVASNLVLNLFGFGVYVLTTFLLCALIYKEADAGYLMVSAILLASYYAKFFILTADFGLAPSVPALRIFPLKDEDAVFLYHWTIKLTVAGIGFATVAYLFKFSGIGNDLFHLLYGVSGLAVNLLLIMMIWRSRKRVALVIRSGADGGKCAPGSIREKFAKSWHFFAVIYVIIIGIYWFINALAGRGAILELIITLFMIPLFIGVDRWIQRLLKIASGELPEVIDLSEDATDEGPETTGAQDKKEIKQFVPLISTAFRVVLVICFFFAVLKLWGLDLPVGRLLTRTVFSSVGALLLGWLGWQYIKTLIDRRLKEEMPDEEIEMEAGGAGGSRTATLLMLLRKFALAVMIVMIALVVLSSLGINIAPLIAGAGVIGLAIGFGAQTLVKDIISGIFFLIDDAFRVGDYIETAGTKGMVEHISLRSLRLRHPRGPVFTIPFGGMGTVKNNSRDYIIEKLDFRVRYDTDVDKVRKIIKRINKEIQHHEEMGPVMLGKIKSQGVRELDDSAMIMRVKFKTIPGEQFVVRREVFQRMQEAFRDNGIEFAHRNVTVYLPPETNEKPNDQDQDSKSENARPSDSKVKEAAGAAAAIAALQAEEDKRTEL